MSPNLLFVLLVTAETTIGDVLPNAERKRQETEGFFVMHLQLREMENSEEDLMLIATPLVRASIRKC